MDERARPTSETGLASSDRARRGIERLAAPQAPAPSTASAPAPAELVDQKKLEALAKPAEAPAPVKAPTEREKPADLAKANEKLSSLLGNPKSE